MSDALAPLMPEQLALRLMPDLRSFGKLVCHVIGSRARWFSWALDAGDEQWHKPAPGSAPKTASELIVGLAATWQVMQQTIADYTLADLREEITRERGGRTRVFSRGWVIWHVIEHDLHHGGEISLTLGIHRPHAPDI